MTLQENESEDSVRQEDRYMLYIKWYFIIGFVIINGVGLFQLIKEYGVKEPILIFVAYPGVLAYVITFRLVNWLVFRKLRKIDPYMMGNSRVRSHTLRRFKVNPGEFYKLRTKLKILFRKPGEEGYLNG